MWGGGNRVKQKWIGLKQYFSRHVIARKMIIFGCLVGVWVSLLLGAVFSPQRQLYTDEQLNPKQIFPNGTGELQLMTENYSESNGLLVLQFETSDYANTVSNGINPDKLKWQLYSKKELPETEMEVIPIIDNKILVIIKQLPKDFEAIAIQVKNETVDINDIDLSISPNKNAAEQKEAGESENEVQFMIPEKNERMKKGIIKEKSREQFAIEHLQEEIDFQQSQIKKLDQSIDLLEEAIKESEKTKERLEQEAQYLTGEEKQSNENDIQTVSSDIQTRLQSIETAKSDIETVTQKIDLLKQKIKDIENGTFDFQTTIKTIKMKD